MKGDDEPSWALVIEAWHGLKDCKCNNSPTTPTAQLLKIAHLLDSLNQTGDAACQLLREPLTARLIFATLPILSWLVCHNKQLRHYESTVAPFSLLRPLLTTLHTILQAAQSTPALGIFQATFLGASGLTCLYEVLVTVVNNRLSGKHIVFVDVIFAILSKFDGALAEQMAEAPKLLRPPPQVSHLIDCIRPQTRPFAVDLLCYLDHVDDKLCASVDVELDMLCPDRDHSSCNQRITATTWSSSFLSCIDFLRHILWCPKVVIVLAEHPLLVWQLLRPIRSEVHITFMHWLTFQSKVEFVTALVTRQPHLQRDIHHHGVFDLLEDWWYYLQCVQFRVNAPVKHLVNQQQPTDLCFASVNCSIAVLLWSLCRDNLHNTRLLLAHELCTRLLQSARICMGTSVSPAELWHQGVQYDDDAVQPLAPDAHQQYRKVLKLAELTRVLEQRQLSASTEPAANGAPRGSTTGKTDGGEQQDGNCARGGEQTRQRVVQCVVDIAGQLKQPEFGDVEDVIQEGAADMDDTLQVIRGATNGCASIWRVLSALSHPKVSCEDMLEIAHALSTHVASVVDGTTMYTQHLSDPSLFEFVTLPTLQALLWVLCRNSSMHSSELGHWLLRTATGMLRFALLPSPATNLHFPHNHAAFVRAYGMSALRDVLNSIHSHQETYTQEYGWSADLCYAISNVMILLVTLEMHVGPTGDGGVATTSPPPTFAQRVVDRDVPVPGGSLSDDLLSFALSVEHQILASAQPEALGKMELTCAGAFLCLLMHSSGAAVESVARQLWGRRDELMCVLSPCWLLEGSVEAGEDGGVKPAGSVEAGQDGTKEGGTVEAGQGGTEAGDGLKGIAERLWATTEGSGVKALGLPRAMSDRLWKIVALKVDVISQVLNWIPVEERVINNLHIFDVIAWWWRLLASSPTPLQPAETTAYRSKLATLAWLLCDGCPHNTLLCLRNRAFIPTFLDVIQGCVEQVSPAIKNDILSIVSSHLCNTTGQAVELVCAVGGRLLQHDANIAVVGLREEGQGREVSVFLAFFDQIERYYAEDIECGVDKQLFNGAQAMESWKEDMTEGCPGLDVAGQGDSTWRDRRWRRVREHMARLRRASNSPESTATAAQCGMPSAERSSNGATVAQGGQRQPPLNGAPRETETETCNAPLRTEENGQGGSIGEHVKGKSKARKRSRAAKLKGASNAPESTGGQRLPPPNGAARETETETETCSAALRTEQHDTAMNVVLPQAHMHGVGPALSLSSTVQSHEHVLQPSRVVVQQAQQDSVDGMEEEMSWTPQCEHVPQSCAAGHAEDEVVPPSCAAGHAEDELVPLSCAAGHAEDELVPPSCAAGHAEDDHVLPSCAAGHAEDEHVPASCAAGHAEYGHVLPSCAAGHAEDDHLMSSCGAEHAEDEHAPPSYGAGHAEVAAELCMEHDSQHCVSGDREAHSGVDYAAMEHGQQWTLVYMPCYVPTVPSTLPSTCVPQFAVPCCAVAQPIMATGAMHTCFAAAPTTYSWPPSTTVDPCVHVTTHVNTPVNMDHTQHVVASGRATTPGYNNATVTDEYCHAGPSRGDTQSCCDAASNDNWYQYAETSSRGTQSCCDTASNDGLYQHAESSSRATTSACNVTATDAVNRYVDAPSRAITPACDTNAAAHVCHYAEPWSGAPTPACDATARSEGHHVSFFETSSQVRGATVTSYGHVSSSNSSQDDLTIATLMATLCPRQHSNNNNNNNSNNVVVHPQRLPDRVERSTSSSTAGCSNATNVHASLQSVPHGDAVEHRNRDLSHTLSTRQARARRRRSEPYSCDVVDSRDGARRGEGETRGGEGGISAKTRRLYDDMFCPITQEAMMDPVMAFDGYTYEAAAIGAWLEQHDTSPMTNEVLESKRLIPNKAMYAMIQEALAAGKR